VLAAFNTWAFKREQPAEPALLAERVEGAIRTGNPLAFVLYWGKGPRTFRAPPDDTCLDYLADMARRIAAVHRPGAAVTLLLTDTHARLNGHDESGIAGYFDAIAAAAAKRGFDSRRLSQVVTASGVAATRPTLDAADRETLADLVASARKWYRGNETPEAGAERYFAVNMVERRAVAMAYPDAIFVSFNSSRIRALFPDSMPLFFMYSLKKGVAVKPWFMDANGNPFAGAPALAE
jgi:hypothetical protein